MQEKLTKHEAEVARLISGGHSYQELRATGRANDGDFNRIVDKGALNANYPGRHTLTDHGRNETRHREDK